MIERLLKNWHKQIPAMSCEPGCRECCEGDARAMTLHEWREIRHPGKYARGVAIAACPFLGDFGCEIYQRRPLICRLFGAVAPDDPALADLEGNFPIACPRSCKPTAPLSLAAALKIQISYQEYANREMERVIGDWQKYLRAGVAPALDTELPEKFVWLRYVLSTREGQTTLRLLWGAAQVNIDPVRMQQMAEMIGG